MLERILLKSDELVWYDGKSVYHLPLFVFDELLFDIPINAKSDNCSIEVGKFINMLYMMAEKENVFVLPEKTALKRVAEFNSYDFLGFDAETIRKIGRRSS